MFGVLAFIVSVTQMKENWRAGVQKEEKTNLVTTGIYSISRNPAFLGFDLMYIGILFSFFNWFLCFATGFAVVFFHLQIVNVEEDFLIEAFGNEYLQYKSKVCRYLGRKDKFQFAVLVPGRVWSGTAFARWSSNESPSGAFKRRRGLRQQMEGHCPDKHAQQEHFGNSQELEK